MRREVAVGAVAVAVAAAVVFLKIESLPMVDQAVSARPIWRQIAGQRDNVCIEWVQRRYRYGLNYYSVTPLPDCSAEEKTVHVVHDDIHPPALRPPAAAR